MSDYTKLVKALRYCGNFAEREGCAESCEYFNDMDCPNRIMSDAAAAIEELQQIADHHEQTAKDYWKEACEYKAQFPKRGKWIIDGAYTYNLRELNGKAYEPVYRCSCCNRQTESYLRLDEPKMPEDADFPEYCPHCGAKMEVQE